VPTIGIYSVYFKKKDTEAAEKYQLLGKMNDTTINGSCVLEDIMDRDVLTPHYWDIQLQNLPKVNLATTTCLLLIILTAVPLNFYILGRIIWKKLYYQPTYFLFLNYAIVDLLMSLVPMLFRVITGFNGHYSFGDSDYVRCQVCKIAASLIILLLASEFTLALISLDRFIYFKFPLRYETLVTFKKTSICVFITWLLAFLLGIPSLIGYGDIKLSTLCGVIFTAPVHIQNSLVSLILTGIAHTAVFIVLTVTNIWIIWIAVKQIKATKTAALHTQPIENDQQKVLEEQLAQKQRKLCRTFGSILAVNCLTILPVIALAIALTITSSIPTRVYQLVLISVMSNVTLHPLVEAFMTPELRCHLRDMCKSPSWSSDEGRDVESCC